MPANIIRYAGKTLIDLTEDTVTPETLDKGVTAHDKTGAPITGTRETGGAEDLDTVLTEQEALIERLKEILDTKASGGGSAPATIGENLHDVSTDVLNKYINGANILDYAGWDLTDYIPVEGGKYYIIYSNGTIKSDYCSMFDENKVFKEKLSGNITSTDLNQPLFVPVKNNGYVRLSGSHTQISAMKFYEVLNLKFEVPDLTGG